MSRIVGILNLMTIEAELDAAREVTDDHTSRIQQLRMSTTN
jgi:hypothetical protein